MRPALFTARRASGPRRAAALAGLGLLAGLLAGCGSSVKLDETQVVDAKAREIGPIAAPGSTVTPPEVSPTADSRVVAIALDRAPVPIGALGRTVYFDFDSFVVKEDFRGLIESHARALAQNKGRQMRVEGHTDDRGGREYNLALGQKRAEAVAKSLALLGAGDAQIEAVSYGKERPAVEGQDEAAWAKNRRAELKDR